MWTWTAMDSPYQAHHLLGSADPAMHRQPTGSWRTYVDGWRRGCNSRPTGYTPYLIAVPAVFGKEIDFAQLVKLYGKDGSKRDNRTVIGNPDPAALSTSHVERQNLNIRMGNRRFYAEDQCVQQEVCQPLSLAGAVLHLLQLLPDAPDIGHDAGDGCRVVTRPATCWRAARNPGGLGAILKLSHSGGRSQTESLPTLEAV